jgi:hypothetical protein
MTRLLIVAFVLAGCGKKEESETRTVIIPPRDGGAAVKPAGPPDAAVGKAPEPGKLEVCGAKMADEPLAAICKLGTPAEEFPFNGCEKPPVLGWCKKTTMFACRSSNLPPTTYQVNVESTGPPPKSGEVVDLAKEKPVGPVKGVQIAMTEADEPKGEARATALAATLERWGCVVTDRGSHASTDLDCGSWEADVSYNEIIGKVFVKAAWRGWLDCQ